MYDWENKTLPKQLAERTINILKQLNCPDPAGYFYQNPDKVYYLWEGDKLVLSLDIEDINCEWYWREKGTKNFDGGEFDLIVPKEFLDLCYNHTNKWKIKCSNLLKDCFMFPFQIKPKT